jgi:malate dehydrogenase
MGGFIHTDFYQLDIRLLKLGGIEEMKVSIVGAAGAVGSGAAYRIARDGYVSEIVLVDVRKNLAKAHALDIEQAVVNRATTNVRAGELTDTKDSDVIIMTAGIAHRPAVTRSEFLKENLPIVMHLTKKLVETSPSAFWLIATVPVDPLVFLIHQIFSIPSHKVVGLNRNDTCRFRWAIAKTLSVPSTSIKAFVLGEHGQTQVPIFSQILVDGKKVLLTPEQVENVRTKISGFFKQWNTLSPNRTAGWASAESLGDMIMALASGSNEILNCSTPLVGEYGLSGVSIGVPVRLNKDGVRQIIEIKLDQNERVALEASAAAVKEGIVQAWALINSASGYAGAKHNSTKGGFNDEKKK